MRLEPIVGVEHAPIGSAVVDDPVFALAVLDERRGVAARVAVGVAVRVRIAAVAVAVAVAVGAVAVLLAATHGGEGASVVARFDLRRNCIKRRESDSSEGARAMVPTLSSRQAPLVPSRRVGTRWRHRGSRAVILASSSADAKKAVVVGAGPAGSLSALYLANLGWHVKVYERRAASGDARGADAGAGRPDISYNVVLSPRGMNALAGAGVTLPEERVVRMVGNVRHLPGAAPAVSRQFKGTVAVNRDALSDAIASTAATRHPERIEFTRGYGVRDVDFARRVAVFAPSDAPSDDLSHDDEDACVSAPYDLLVAADGVNSAVRSMLAKGGDVRVTQNADEMMFKTVKLPARNDADGEEAARCFHTWPRGLVSMLAPPDPAGTLSGVIILPGGAHAGAHGGARAGARRAWTWDAVADEDDVRALFEDEFPDAFNGAPVPPTAVAQILAQRCRRGGVTTRCSRLANADGSVVLAGDAAHSCWPSLGQGANCALETAQYLATAIESMPDDLRGAVRRFDEVRTPQVHACGRLSEAGFGGVAKRAGNFFFFAKIGLLALLNKAMPFFFDKPALANINDPAWAYDDVEDAVAQETQALAAFGGVLLAASVGVVAFGWEQFIGASVGAVKAIALGEGTAADEGAALAALGSAAAMTGLFRWLAKRRRERRKGNMSPAVFVSPSGGGAAAAA